MSVRDDVDEVVPPNKLNLCMIFEVRVIGWHILSTICSHLYGSV